jgi:hypothetical protein
MMSLCQSSDYLLVGLISQKVLYGNVYADLWQAAGCGNNLWKFSASYNFVIIAFFFCGATSC